MMPHLVTPPRRVRFPTRLTLAVTLVVAGTLAGIGGVIVSVAAAHAAPRIDDVRLSDEELALGAARAERAGAIDQDARLEVLRDDFALFFVARSVGATDVTRPDDILDIRDDVNMQRSSTATAGGVLYGPVTYEAASFYGKALSDIRQAALSRLESGAAGVSVGDAEVRSRFDADPAQWADAATSYRLTRITVPTAVDGGPDPAVVAALGTAGAAGVLDACPREAVTLTPDERAAATLGPEATAAVVAAPDGAFLGPFPERGTWVAYRLDGRSVDAEEAFTHYATRIRTVLFNERLDALIAEARSAQTVVGP